MKLIQKLLLFSIAAFFLCSIVTMGFIGANESFSLNDAGIALDRYYKHLLVFQELQAGEMPIGFGSVQVKDLGDSIQSTAGGLSGKGNALAIYITPDFLPVLTVILLVGASFLATLLLLSTLIDYYNRRNVSRHQKEFDERERISDQI